METFIDWSDEDNVFATSQNGPIYLSTDGGFSLGSVNQAPGQGNWVTPLEQDPIVPTTLYTGKSQLYKSTDFADSWTAISNFNGGKMYELKIHPLNSDIMYCAFFEKLYKTTDGGANWTDVSPSTPFILATYIGLHPTDINKVAITLSGANEKILESTDGGMTWVDITGALPDIGINTVAYDGTPNNGFYIGMNPGIYFKDDNNTSWFPYMHELPNVNITEFEFHDNYIYAGTYGRGLWKNEVVNTQPCELIDVVLGETISCGDGTSDIEIEIIYDNAPFTGGIIVNGNTLPIDGSPQVILSSNLSNGSDITFNVSFENENTCIISKVISIPDECICHPDLKPLRELYAATDGGNWNNTLNNELLWDTLGGTNCDVCTWYGIKCNNLGRVIDINLYANNLIGSIPNRIGDLEFLEFFQLGQNKDLGGDIPASFWSISTLKGVFLWSTNLTGSLPAQISHLSNLVSLVIGYNEMSGPFPTDIADLPNLRNVQLNSIGLTGTIPEQLYSRDLWILSLTDNELTGQVSPSIEHLDDVSYLRLGGNNLTGAIPDQLWNLTGLTNLSLHNNSFTGQIPASIGLIKNLTRFTLQDNNFDGTIPEDIRGLSKMYYMNLGNNNFSGHLPDVFDVWNDLENISIYNNSFEGELPASLGRDKPQLRVVSFGNNNFSGCFPPSYANLCWNRDNIQYPYFQFGSNPLLPGGGDFDAICDNDFSGVCSKVDLVFPQTYQVLDNGCTDNSNQINWAFKWDILVPSSKYHLQVWNAVTNSVLINNSNISTNHYQFTSNNYFPDAEKGQWVWSIIPYYDGAWQTPSDTLILNIEPVNFDCRGCMDALSHNYDPTAIVEDNSCTTCYDGIQNGDETAVDCGGSCYPCEPVEFCNKILLGSSRYDLLSEELSQYSSNLNPNAVAFDEKNNKVYWTDQNLHQVLRANYDGSSKEIVIQYSIERPFGIDIDTLNEKIYLTDEGLGHIVRYNLDGTKREIILSELKNPGRIKVDPIAKYIFWEEENKLIRRSDLHGNCRTTLYESFSPIHGLSLDYNSQKIYWTHFRTGASLYEGDYQGATESELLSAELTNPVATTLDHLGNIYILEQGKSNRLVKWSLANQQIEDVIVHASGLYSIDYSISDHALVYTSWATDFVWYYNLNTSSSVLIDYNDFNFYPSSYTFYNGDVIYLQGSDIGIVNRADPLNSNIQFTLPTSNNWEIEADTVNDRLLWTSFDPPALNSIDFDGNNHDVIFSGSLPTGIVIDYIHQKRFWCDYNYGTVYRSNLDGSVEELILSGIDGPDGIDLSDTHLYIGEWNTGSIYRSDLDGSGLTEVYSHYTSSSTYDIVYVSDEDRIYFTNSQDGLLSITSNGDDLTYHSYYKNSDRLTVSDEIACNPCYDGILNGDETAIDCGGSCKPCDECENMAAVLKGPIKGNRQVQYEYWLKLKNAELMSSSDITYKAGDYIELNTGTMIHSGSKFQLDIAPCESPVTLLREQNDRLYRKSNPEMGLIEGTSLIDKNSENMYSDGRIKEGQRPDQHRWKENQTVTDGLNIPLRVVKNIDENGRSNTSSAVLENRVMGITEPVQKGE